MGKYLCKKCGAETSPSAFLGYCSKCNEEFNVAIRNGAVRIYKGIFADLHYWRIQYKQSDEQYPSSQNPPLNQVKAIVKAREIARKEGIEKIVFEYSPHRSRWFLDEYLESHPRIRANVLKAEARKKRKTKKSVMKMLKFLLFTIVTMFPTILYAYLLFLPEIRYMLEFLFIIAGDALRSKYIIPNIAYQIAWGFTVFSALHHKCKWWYHLVLLLISLWNWYTIFRIIALTNFVSSLFEG